MTAGPREAGAAGPAAAPSSNRHISVTAAQREALKLRAFHPSIIHQSETCP